ncbi:FHA domain-containing protein [Xenorhabdus budapestensis]|uniref:FHA domain-containing protein n=1 Tax=Xenorhabdus budapestensis TaxID=290110 RepID=A0ABX7VPJ3_XENBU|nr:type VI secretion system-associated FHA domain protein [Xenorhabdus budapestensis]QTL41482.1 FHA domain-containing protein [Xenorhabdus budapestensis]
MRFTIVKNSGTNQPIQLSYDFSPPGGTIGRSKDNNWILPDEEQAIARLQAVVSISADGECRITNRGSASELLLNTIPLAPDRQVEIRDGDVLNIGDYQIQAVDINKSAPPQATTRVINTESQSATNCSGIPNEIWDGLEQIFTAPDTSSSPNRYQATSEGNDNNPLLKSQQQENDERNPIDPLAQIENTTDLETLQLRATDPVTMFHSDALFQQEDILNNNTPTTLFQYDDQEIDDPLNLMLDNAVPLTSPDNPKISDSQFAPVSQPISAQDKQSIAQPPSLPSLFTTEEISKELSKDLAKNYTGIEETKTKENIFPPFPPVPSNEYPDYQASANHQTHIKHQVSNANNSLHITHDNHAYERLGIDPISYSSSNHQTDGIKLEGKLLASLLEGMGLKNLHQPQFDEHRMYQLGLFISQLSQGVVALNTSRTMLKREADADMTQMLLDANNPFKLLPSGQSVLVQMFGDHMPGFMPIEQATRDILIELQAHQLGMIAGVRAITRDILQLFHPGNLEQKAQDEGGMPRLSLSSTYKTSLWEFLTKYYQKTANEFEQNSVLFGENFLQAYEKEVNKYKNSQSKLKK